MKVLLANPLYVKKINKKFEQYYIRSGSRWPHSGIKRIDSSPHYAPFPFFLAYSAALLKKYNFEVYVLDAVALGFNEVIFLEKVNKVDPDLIFYEAITPTFEYDLLLAKRLKNVSNAKIVLGGSHAGFFGEEIIENNKYVDFVIKGSYENKILELSKTLRDKSGEFTSGVIYKDENDRVATSYKKESVTIPFDKFPFPLRDIFPYNDLPDLAMYWDGFCQMRPVIQMQTSRGCGHSCYFCLWPQTMYDSNKYVKLSPERVVDEIEFLVDSYKVKEIYIDDDDFMFDNKRVVSICEEILSREIKVKWSCMGNISSINVNLLKIMAKSGCIGLKFGIESIGHKSLKNVSKDIDFGKVEEIISFCRKYSIKTHAAFVLGLLGDEGRDIKETERFVRNFPVDSIQVSNAVPYPGTEFFEIVKRKGLLEGVSWESYDGKGAEFVYSSFRSNLTAAQLRKKVFTSWILGRLLSPAWLFYAFRRFLTSLKSQGFNFFFKKLRDAIIDIIEHG